MVSLDDENITLLSNGQLEITFVVRSSDPMALDIVAKEATAMTGVSYTLKDRAKSAVTVRARVHEPTMFSSAHPFIKDFYSALESAINGVSRTRTRRNGMRIH